MAQTGFTPIQIYYSTTSSNVPLNTNLTNGELAINSADGKLFYKDSGGTVQTLASHDLFASQTANYVYASPNGSAGVPTFRALVSADIPALSGTYIPYTGASSAVDLNAKTLVNIANLGVNTTSVPTIRFRAYGDNNSTSRIAMRGYSSDANSSAIRVSKFRGTVAAPQAPISGDSLGKFELAGYGTTSADAYAQVSLEGVTTEIWGATARGAKALIKVTPNTTITQVTAVTIDQDKSITLAGALNVTGTTTLATSLSGLAKLTSGVVSAASSGTDYAPATSGSSILYGNGAGGFSNVTIGTGVSFAGGTLSATGSGGTVTSVTGTAPVVSSGGTTPAISMAAATTSVSGYLTTTDWNTFNNKGSGTVTSVAALTLGTTGTDLTSTVATGTTTPVITLNVPTASASNRGALSSADWTTFNNKQPAGTYVTNLTGPITSVGNATSIASQTGTGTKFVVDNTPTLITPVLGVATATSINKMAITAPATSSTLAVADGKTHTVNNSIALSGTDSTTMTFPTTSATIARTDAAQTFTGLQTFGALTTTGNVILGDASTDTLNVGNGDLIKDASGNVGIGVTPSAWNAGKALEIGTSKGNALWGLGINSMALTSNAYYNGSYIYANNGTATSYNNGGGAGTHAWFIAPSGTAGNAITFTQAMTLDASGNLGVGGSPNAKIHAITTAKYVGRFDSTDTSSNNVLISNVNNYNYGIFGCTSGNGTSTGDVYGLGYSASAGTLFTPVISYKSTKAVRFDGYGAGAITSDASGNLTAVSDEGVKKDIRPFTKGLAEIIAIAQDPKGVILYGYTKESGLDQTKNDYAGWSAQVVQQSIPEAVGKMQDEIDADGVLITEGCLTLNPFVIVAAQTNAINELNNTIEKLLKRIELLEQK